MTPNPEAGEQCECAAREALAEAYAALAQARIVLDLLPNEGSVAGVVGRAIEQLRSVRRAPCPCEGMRQAAASQERERKLRAELRVRTNVPTFEIEVPSQFRKAGARSAFNSGYETAWHNQQYRNPYARSDCERAYYEGYRAGEAKSAEAIWRELSTASALKAPL